MNPKRTFTQFLCVFLLNVKEEQKRARDNKYANLLTVFGTGPRTAISQ